MKNLSLLLFLLFPVPGLLDSGRSLCSMDKAIDKKIKQGFSSLWSEAVVSSGIQCRTVSSRGDLASCPEGLAVTSCSCGSACGSWDVREETTCHCQCAGIDWTAARCCALGVGICGHLGGPGPKAVVIYFNQPRRMQASASQDKNRRKPGHNEGTHHPDYENITLAFRNREELKLNQSAPKKQAQVKPSPDTPQIPPWLHRTIMILYVLLAFIFSFCIILSALVLVKNSEMSRELWSLRVELLNVSSLVLKCQDQQNNHWKAVQTDIREAKSNIATVSSKVQSGNDKLKTVPGDITDIKKTLQALEKKALAPPTSK